MYTIKEISDVAIKMLGNSADAILLVAVDGDRSKTFMVGYDETAINKPSIITAAALQSLLEDKFEYACEIIGSLKEQGKFDLPETHEERISCTTGKPERKTERRSGKKSVKLSELFTMLADIIDKAEEAEIDEDDD